MISGSLIQGTFIIFLPIRYRKKNKVCKVFGIDTIQIKMHGDITRTLTNVRHILELKKF